MVILIIFLISFFRSNPYGFELDFLYITDLLENSLLLMSANSQSGYSGALLAGIITLIIYYTAACVIYNFRKFFFDYRFIAFALFFLLVYYSVNFNYSKALDGPVYYGFPFWYYEKSCGFRFDDLCTTSFRYPTLIIDVLIWISISLLIGLWRKKKRS